MRKKEVDPLERYIEVKKARLEGRIPDYELKQITDMVLRAIRNAISAEIKRRRKR